MKKIFRLFAMGLVFAGCSGGGDENVNTAPLLTINGSSEIMIKDSIKLGLKYGNNPYPFSVTIDDMEDHAVTLAVSLEGEGFLKDAAGNIIDGNVDLEQNAATLWFEAVETCCANTIRFTATDEHNQSQTTTVKLLAFKNLAPTARFTIKPNPADGPFGMVYDASESFDVDHNFGGEIRRYQFTITGSDYEEIINSATPVVNHILPGKDDYKIKLEVMDNDGAVGLEIINIRL